MTRVEMRRRGDDAILRFEYDPSLVKTVKGLEKRTFDAMAKEWVIPLHLYLDAAARLEAVGAEVLFDEELTTLRNREIVPPPKKPEVTISRVGEEYIVQFEYDANLVRATKGLPKRSFDPASKAWSIPIGDEEGTLRQLIWTYEGLGSSVRLEPKLRPRSEGPPSPEPS